MEKLMELRKQLGKDITVIYKNNKIFVLVHHGKTLDHKRLLIKGITEEYRQEISNTVKNLYETMTLLADR